MDIQRELQLLQQELTQSTFQLLSLQKEIRALRRLDNSEANAESLSQKTDLESQLKADVEALHDAMKTARTSLELLNIIPVEEKRPCSSPATTRSGKLPTDLPKFIPGETELETFFKVTEAKLRSHSTPVADWYKALGKQANDDITLLWVNEHILTKEPDWDAAKKIFTKEFATLGDNVSRSRDQLLSLHQGKLSSAKFFRQVEQLAAITNQNKDDPFFLDYLRRVRMNPKVIKQISLRLGVDAYKLNFAQLKQEAIYIESIFDQYNGRSTTDNDAESSCRSCGGNHHRKNCPHKRSKCDKCGKQGHIATACQQPDEVKKEISDVECFKCGHKGHYANDPVCPKFTVKKSDEQAADASTIRMVRKPEESEVCVFDDAEANAVLDLLRVPYND